MYKYQLNIIFLFTMLLFSTEGVCQEMIVIQLQNPSFEDYPRAGTNDGRGPSRWYDCGTAGETAPDIHPATPPGPYFFDVSTPAHDGNTYLGLVVRSNETYEAIGQRLSKPLERGKAYSFGLHLAKSSTYMSPVKKGSEELSNYNTPAKVRIWGGNGYCNQGELLDESDPIAHSDWRQYQFRFEPQKNHSFIRIEVYWKTPVPIPYRGNVLVDNATSIFEVAIDKPSEPLPGSEAPLVKILNPQRSGRKSQDNTFLVEATIENVFNRSGLTFSVNGNGHKFSYDPKKGSFKSNISLKKGNNNFRIKASNANGTHQDEAVVVYTPKVTTTPDPPPVANTNPSNSNPLPKPSYDENPELRNGVKAGQKIRINNLRFAIDSYVIKTEAYSALNEFASYLLLNPQVRIEVGGHTNDRCHEKVCNQLSENRAKAVADYLKNKGISSSRIIFKGYGKTQPVSNNTNSIGRERNQRVEIKIL